MGWGIVIQELLSSAIRQKSKAMGMAEILEKARYFPVLIFLGFAPGLLFITALSMALSAGVVQFYPQYFFPTDLVLSLAGVALLASAITYLIYLRVIRTLGAGEAQPELTTVATKLEDDVGRVIRPLKEQFLAEHEAMKEALQGRAKTREQPYWIQTY